MKKNYKIKTEEKEKFLNTKLELTFVITDILLRTSNMVYQTPIFFTLLGTGLL